MSLFLSNRGDNMIIDAHSHIGKDYYFGESSLFDYDNFCLLNNINIGLLMPMPWPVLKDKNNSTCALIWEHTNYEKIHYYKQVNHLGKILKEKILCNPYEKVNKYYFDLISKSNTKTKIYFVPMIHGVLDDPYYVDNLIKETKPKAIKFHGFSGGFFKEDVKPELIEIFKFYNVPIILHTSVYNYDDGYGLETKFWRNKCCPNSWVRFLIDNNLRGTLNHGACLDKEVIKIVNNSENIMIGLGPDLDISLDPYKVCVPKNKYFSLGYLNILKKLVSADKLLFDLDYNWNVDCCGNIDYNSLDRIRNTWTYSDCEKILSQNAKQFYKLTKNK